MKSDMTVSEFRHALRAEATSGGTQAQFAKRLEVTPQYLSDIINGNRPPSDGILSALGLEWRICKKRRP